MFSFLIHRHCLLQISSSAIVICCSQIVGWEALLLLLPEGQRVVWERIYHGRNNPALPGWQQLCRITKGEVKLQDENSNTFSPGSATHSAMRKTMPDFISAVMSLYCWESKVYMIHTAYFVALLPGCLLLRLPPLRLSFLGRINF